MRAHELINYLDLFEIKMGSRSLARASNAIIGMEFEMIMPDILPEGNNTEAEMDLTEDEKTQSISNIIRFFTESEYNTGRALVRLETQLREQYDDWFASDSRDAWDDAKIDIINDYVKNQEFDNEEKRNEKIKELLSDDDELNNFRDKFIDEYTDNNYENSENDWLTQEGLYHMSDILSQYNITWPYWNYPEILNPDSESLAFDIIYERLRPFVKMPVVISSKQNYDTEYGITVDPSIDTSNYSNAFPLEIIGPKLSIDKMIDHFNRIKKFATAYNCKTNDTTGLHINVSIPGKTQNDLNFVKLALFMGDEWTLNAFDRLTSEHGKKYTASVMQKITDNLLLKNPDAALELLKKLDTGFNTLMAQTFTDQLYLPKKYVSANVRESNDLVVEFRSPGGDWLNDKKAALIISTVYRFAVALDAATNPEKFKSEYLKKLYALLRKAMPQNVDAIDLFIKYKNEPSVLKTQLKQLALSRKTSTQQAYEWEITVRGQPSLALNVVARSKEEAIEKFTEYYSEIDFKGKLSTITARPIAQAT